MKINRQIVVFDAADLAAESSFWARMLDGTVDAEDDWHFVSVDGQWRTGASPCPLPRPETTGNKRAGCSRRTVLSETGP
ncbi:VOC family protein [Amycolatopsis sp. GA6-003]|uniref:VOC family protein n=1 Tax=Amycolatopsis sp. GA6-003 TaxID=2652444 RepID=UPI003916F859